MASITASSSTVAGPRTAVTLNLASLTASTAYVLAVKDGTGQVTTVDITTDGTGAFSYVYVPQAHGAVTATVTPAAAQSATASLSGVTVN